MVKIEVGDSLVDVDGTPVTGDNAPEVLRGSDIVGSLARLRLEKRGGGGGPAGLIEVKIARSSIARIKPLSEMVLAMAKVCGRFEGIIGRAGERRMRQTPLTSPFLPVRCAFLQGPKSR